MYFVINRISTLTDRGVKNYSFLLLTKPTIFLLITLLLTLPAPTRAQATAERIAVAGYRNGQWDIYSINPDGTDPRQLTNDVFEDADPAYSPDGSKIAFASRRNNNWDIFILNLTSGEETQLTNAPHYDGAPAWHPNGNLLAYESFQAGDLDIWQIAADGAGTPVNLTADSSAGDFAPAWSPDGQTIVFTSWRNENRDLFLLNVSGGEVTQLTNSPAAEEWAVWHPNGQTLAYVNDDLGDREIFTLNLAAPPINDGPVQPVTWLGRTDGPAWSPSGDQLAAIFHRWDGQMLTTQNPDAQHKLPNELTDIVTLQGRLSWHGQTVNFGQPVTSLHNTESSSLYEEQLTLNPPPATEPYNLIRQNDLDVGTPWLADTVDDSFQAWRLRMRQEAGYDFLAQLSDASRTVSAYSDTSQYASWHKSGRAIDTLFDYHTEGQLAHEIVREDYSGETFWRVYLRCLDQSGACGRPLTVNPWNYSARARTEIAPEQGGIEKANITGYYIDMTAMAREYGWERISSYDDLDYSWTWHFLAFEYWHYQKRLEDESALSTGASNWYEAMSHVYSQETLDEYFTWEIMRSLGEDPYLIALKGVPLPLEVMPWWALVKH